MNIITIQDRLTDKAKSEAAVFLDAEFAKLYRALPVSNVPSDSLSDLKKAIESNPKQSLNLEYVFRQLRHAVLPDVQTIFINKASQEFLTKVEASQTQLEEIQSQLP